jgi:hypothetical protein
LSAMRRGLAALGFGRPREHRCARAGVSLLDSMFRPLNE